MCPARKMIVQLLTIYTESVCHNAQHYTLRDDSMIPTADHTECSSTPAKNQVPEFCKHTVYS